MQCNDMRTVLSVDKKLIANHLMEYKDKFARKIINRILKAGNNCWELGIEIYFTDKKWNFYNREPSGTIKKQWEQYWLWKNGFYKASKVGCGQCEICRIEKSKQWAVKSACESKIWKENICFLTLTYNEDNLELNNGYINKADMQTFWKNLRYHLYKNTKKAKKIDMSEEYENMKEIPNEIKLKYMISKRKPQKKPLRYINCNEYGERKGRAHAHAVCFNFKPTDLKRYKRDKRGYWLYKSKKINSIWGHGYIIIADVNANVAAYVARYNTKKFSNISGKVNGIIRKLNEAYKNAHNDEAKQILKEHLQVWKERRENISASSMGYIGSYYWETNKETIIKNGGILVNWSKGVHLEKIPKPMEKQFESEYPMEFEVYDYWKERNGREQWQKILSQTDLSESEYIQKTFESRMKKVRKLKREYDQKPTRQSILQNY